MDPFFRIETLRCTPSPQQVIWAAMHQDYYEGFVIDQILSEPTPGENRAGEIAVKKLLAGGRGHYGCYFEDTEVLTSQGFVPWAEVAGNKNTIGKYLLAAIDVHSGSLHFEIPSKLFAYDIKDEPLYEVKGRYIDQLVTADHRMPVSSRTKMGWSDWRFERASQVSGKAVRYRLNGNLYPTNKRKEPSSWFRLAGFYFGDGETLSADAPTCVRFRLRRKEKIDWLCRLGFTVVKNKGDRYTLHHAELALWLKKLWHDEREKKKIPEWVICSDDTSFHSLMEGLKASDGTMKKPHGFSFDNTNKLAIDTLQAAAATHGVHGNITLNHPSRNEKHQDCWRIHFNYERHFCRVETQQKGRTKNTTERWVTKTGKVYCAAVSTGALVVRRNGVVSVSGNSLEHPQIIFNVGYFPHSTMQQLRTHRVGISMDVQSFRYTGQRIIDVANWEKTVEEVFYLRPVGDYSDRQGKKYYYSEEQRREDRLLCRTLAERYKLRISQGLSEEHARSLIPFDVRQHFVLSCNVRSLMHLLDLRWKADAQLEAQQFCDLLFVEFKKWCPEIAAWYEKNRAKKARLSP